MVVHLLLVDLRAECGQRRRRQHAGRDAHLIHQHAVDHIADAVHALQVNLPGLRSQHIRDFVLCILRVPCGRVPVAVRVLSKVRAQVPGHGGHRRLQSRQNVRALHEDAVQDRESPRLFPGLYFLKRDIPLVDGELQAVQECSRLVLLAGFIQVFEDVDLVRLQQHCAPVVLGNVRWFLAPSVSGRGDVRLAFFPADNEAVDVVDIVAALLGQRVPVVVRVVLALVILRVVLCAVLAHVRPVPVFVVIHTPVVFQFVVRFSQLVGVIVHPALLFPQFGVLNHLPDGAVLKAVPELLKPLQRPVALRLVAVQEFTLPRSGPVYEVIHPPVPVALPVTVVLRHLPAADHVQEFFVRHGRPDDRAVLVADRFPLFRNRQLTAQNLQPVVPLQEIRIIHRA